MQTVMDSVSNWISLFNLRPLLPADDPNDLIAADAKLLCNGLDTYTVLPKLPQVAHIVFV